MWNGLRRWQFAEHRLDRLLSSPDLRSAARTLVRRVMGFVRVTRPVPSAVSPLSECVHPVRPPCPSAEETAHDRAIPAEKIQLLCRPAHDAGADVQQIRVFIEGLSGQVPTRWSHARLPRCARYLCDKLNHRLGLDR